MAQTSTLLQAVQFTLTVDWAAGPVADRMSLSVGAYMQPQKSLLLDRRRVARESATNEAKHFLHGEGQGAQLDVKHLAAWGKRHPQSSFITIKIRHHALLLPLIHTFWPKIHVFLCDLKLIVSFAVFILWNRWRKYLSTSRNSLSWLSGTSVRIASSHSGIKHSQSGWLMTLYGIRHSIRFRPSFSCVTVLQDLSQ